MNNKSYPVIIQQVLEKLRPYQVEAFNFMQQRRGILNFDDMGLGKTLVTLADIRAKMSPKSGVLIACPTKAFYVWQQEIEKWLGFDCLIYAGTPKQRMKLRPQDYSFTITSYGMLNELKSREWDFLVCDEIHEAGLLNHKTKTYASVAAYVKRDSLISYYLLTGTPIRQGVIDTFAPLHLVDAERFPAYWPFVSKYCVTIQGPFGKDIQRNPKDIEGFRTLIREYSIRRIKKEVLLDLPEKSRQPILLDMTSKQSVLHKDLLEKFLHADEDTVTIAANKMVAMLQIREMLVTPRLLGYDEDGAAFDYLSTTCPPLLEAKESLVIFTPFKKAIPLLKYLIQSWGLGTTTYVLHGGMKPEDFAYNWQSFQNNTTGNKVLLCVIKSGASFHATVADKCFFLGYEWDFNLNIQAEDRLCRMGQKNAVSCYYLTHKGYTVDETVTRKLNSKMDASNWVIGTDDEYQAMRAMIEGTDTR